MPSSALALCAGCEIETTDCLTVDTVDGCLCGSCASEYRHCGDCAEVARPHADFAEYCDDCGDTRCRCEGCRNVILLDDAIYADDETYCESCHCERFTECEACGDTLDRDSALGGADECDYCESCWDARYFHCGGCDQVCSQDDYCSDGRCNDCSPSIPEFDACRFYRETDDCKRTGSLRTFGVELETSECDNAADFDGSYFGSRGDGSTTGPEFVSAVLSGDDGLAAIETFCDEVDAKLDKSCGFHLHIGMRDLTDEQRENVFEAYRAFQPLWQSFVSSFRRGNRYCVPLSNYDDWNRYQWVNARAAFDKHGTFEIRLHSSTLNATKICNWVAAHLRFVEYFANRPAPALGRRATFADLCVIWNDPALAIFYRGRAAEFGTEYTLPDWVTRPLPLFPEFDPELAEYSPCVEYSER